MPSKTIPTLREALAKAREEGPDDEAVWRICPRVQGRNLKPCEHCPAWEADAHFGGDEPVKRGCRAMAEEVVNIVETGNPWRRTENVKAPWTVRFAVDQAVEALADERGWLIEIAGPKWFSAGKIDNGRWNWTRDANAALRFSRREDAETFGKWSSLGEAVGETLRYTEHSWPAVEALAGPEVGDGAYAYADAMDACQDIAGQKLPHEMTPDEQDGANWEGGYIECVERAREGRDKALAGFSAASRPQPEPAAGGWRPIESAPKDGTVIDLWLEPDGRAPDVHWGEFDDDDGEGAQWAWFTEHGDFVAGEDQIVTHWQPSPTPPSAASPSDDAGSHLPPLIAEFERREDEFRQEFGTGRWVLMRNEAVFAFDTFALAAGHAVAAFGPNPRVLIRQIDAPPVSLPFAAASPSPPGLDEERLREALNRAHGLHLSNGTVTLDFHEDEDAAALWNLLERLNR